FESFPLGHLVFRSLLASRSGAVSMRIPIPLASAVTGEPCRLVEALTECAKWATQPLMKMAQPATPPTMTDFSVVFFIDFQSPEEAIMPNGAATLSYLERERKRNLFPGAPGASASPRQVPSAGHVGPTS